MRLFNFPTAKLLCLYTILFRLHVHSDFSVVSAQVSHFSEYWNWSLSPTSQESVHGETVTIPDTSSFPTSLKVLKCNFTTNSMSTGEKSCSDECLVVIKLLLVKLNEQRFLYEDQLEQVSYQCKDNAEQGDDIVSTSQLTSTECNFASEFNNFQFRLPNGKELDCRADCVSDIKRLSEYIFKEKKCYENLLKNKGVIVSSIMSQNYTGAISKFNGLDPSYISPIINDVYAPNTFENLAGFFAKLENTSIRIQFLETLSSKMEKEGHLKTNNVIILKKLVDDEVDRLCNFGSPHRACYRAPQELKKLTDSRADRLIYSWAPKIRATNTQDIINFGSSHKINLAGYAFQNIIYECIIFTLEDSRVNLKNASIFAMSLRWNSHKYQALHELNVWVHEKDDQDKLLIASRIKEAMENLDGPDPPGPTLLKFQQLKDSYRPNIQNVIWQSECFVVNIHIHHRYFSKTSNEYLYSPDAQFNFDGEKKQVLTWRQSDTEIPVGATWKFERVEVNGDIQFLVRNIYWGKYLSVYELSDQKYACLRSNDEDHWRVEFKEHFYGIHLYHVATDTYLQESRIEFKNETMRYVRLARSSSEWKLKCTE